MCGTTPASVQYRHNETVRAIDKKDLDTLNKWFLKAMHHRQLKRTINANKLGNLSYPAQFDAQTKKLLFSKERLLTEQEIFYQFDKVNGAARNLYWNGFFKSIGDGKRYLGQW